jgi:hypothetical protein
VENRCTLVTTECVQLVDVGEKRCTPWTPLRQHSAAAGHLAHHQPPGLLSLACHACTRPVWVTTDTPVALLCPPRALRDVCCVSSPSVGVTPVCPCPLEASVLPITKHPWRQALRVRCVGPPSRWRGPGGPHAACAWPARCSDAAYLGEGPSWTSACLARIGVADLPNPACMSHTEGLPGSPLGGPATHALPLPPVHSESGVRIDLALLLQKLQHLDLYRAIEASSDHATSYREGPWCLLPSEKIMASHLFSSPPIQVRRLYTTIAFNTDSRGRGEVDHTSHCVHCVGAIRVCPTMG